MSWASKVGSSTTKQLSFQERKQIADKAKSDQEAKEIEEKKQKRLDDFIRRGLENQDPGTSMPWYK